MSKLVRARESLGMVDSLIQSLKAPKDIASFKMDWEMSLVHLERVWNRVEGAFGNSAKWGGFSGKYQRARREDQLLAYLRMARDSAEHGITEITNTIPGGMAINPVDKSKPVVIHSLHVSDGRVTMSGSENAQVEIIPPHVELVPVTNRGVVKNVPTLHMGISLENVTMAEALQMARDYYSGLIDQAAAFFEKA